MISTVASGLMLGWHQHEVFPATVRTRGDAFWRLVIYLLEALVFIRTPLALHCQRTDELYVMPLFQPFPSLKPVILTTPQPRMARPLRRLPRGLLYHLIA